MKIVSLFAATCLSALSSFAVAQAADLQGLYDDLFKLPPAERHAKIVEGAKKEGDLSMLPSFRAQGGRDHVAIFRKTYPFMQTRLIDLGAADAVERYMNEERAGRHETDLLSVQLPSVPPILEKNLTVRYRTPMSDRILPQYAAFKDPDNRWLATHWNEHGIVYNSNLVKGADVPHDWWFVCDPKYNGMVSYEPVDEVFQSGLYVILNKDIEQYKKWSECAGKSQPIMMRGHTQRMTLMLTGDHAISADQYIYDGARQFDKNPAKVPFKAVFDAPVIAHGVGIVISKNAQHPYSSALFSDWVLSDESQQEMWNQWRAPITMKSRYIPDSAPLAVFNYLDFATVERITKVWVDATGRKR